jgi:hypothetical protein
VGEWANFDNNILHLRAEKGLFFMCTAERKKALIFVSTPQSHFQVTAGIDRLCLHPLDKLPQSLDFSRLFRS